MYYIFLFVILFLISFFSSRESFQNEEKVLTYYQQTGTKNRSITIIGNTHLIITADKVIPEGSNNLLTIQYNKDVYHMTFLKFTDPEYFFELQPEFLGYKIFTRRYYYRDHGYRIEIHAPKPSSCKYLLINYHGNYVTKRCDDQPISHEDPKYITFDNQYIQYHQNHLPIPKDERKILRIYILLMQFFDHFY